MQQRRLIIGSLILFFFMVTGGLTSCALFEDASGTDLTNAVGLSGGNGPGSGSWIPPIPNNRNQCLQLHATGVTLNDNLISNSDQLEIIRKRCVDENGEFLPGVNVDECIVNFEKFYQPAQNLIADLIVGGTRYEESCTSVDGGDTLPLWPQLAEKDGDEEAPKATAVPEATKEPADKDDTWGCCWCLTCTQRLDTGYVLRPLIIKPSG